MRIVIQFDETKPHWAIQRGYDKLAESLGMSNIKVTGDFDSKVTYIYGTVDNFETFHNAAQNTCLKEGSIHPVQTT